MVKNKVKTLSSGTIAFDRYFNHAFPLDFQNKNGNCTACFYNFEQRNFIHRKVVVFLLLLYQLRQFNAKMGRFLFMK